MGVPIHERLSSPACPILPPHIGLNTSLPHQVSGRYIIAISFYLLFLGLILEDSHSSKNQSVLREIKM